MGTSLEVHGEHTKGSNGNLCKQCLLRAHILTENLV